MGFLAPTHISEGRNFSENRITQGRESKSILCYLVSMTLLVWITETKEYISGFKCILFWSQKEKEHFLNSILKDNTIPSAVLSIVKKIQLDSLLSLY